MVTVTELNRGFDFDGEDVTNVGGFDADSVNTEQIWTSGSILLASDGGALIDRMDPSGSSTPIQDALDALNAAGGGELIIPPGTYDDAGPIRPYNNTSWHCLGGVDAVTINITGSGNNGIEFDRSNLREQHFTGGFTLSGLGSGATTGDAIVQSSGDMVDCHIGPVIVDGWYGKGVDITATANSHFQNVWEWIRFNNVDAGDDEFLFSVSANGPGNQIGGLFAYPTDTTSGSNSNIFRSNSVRSRWDIGWVSVGDTAGIVLQDFGGGVNVSRIYVEKIGSNSANDVIQLGGDIPSHIGNVEIDGDDVDDVYALTNGAGNKHLGPIKVYSGTAKVWDVRVNQDLSSPCVFEGKVSSSTNSSGSELSEPFITTHDVTKKVSTGGGYDGGTVDSQL